MPRVGQTATLDARDDSIELDLEPDRDPPRV